MTMVIERRTSSAAKWSRRLAVFSLVLFATVGTGHRSGLVETPAFFWLAGMVAALAVVALFLAAMGFMRLWEHGDRGGRASTVGAILALVVLAPFFVVSVRAFTLPQLSDVATDPADPPRYLVAVARRTPGMNRIRPALPVEAALQHEAYPALGGRRYALPALIVQEAVALLMEDRNWQVIRAAGTQLDGGEVTIEAVARSRILGFASDVAIRVTDEGDTSYVDMRSALRHGAHDLGHGAANIAGFLHDLDREVAHLGSVPAPEEE